MASRNIKNEIVNNVIVIMNEYLGNDTLQILEKVLISELTRVNMEEITTLPDTWHDDTDKRNQYIIQLFGRVYPHKLRKTLGMHLMNKGVDIGTISEIMGHADTKVTAEYYAQSTPKTLRYIREREHND